MKYFRKILAQHSFSLPIMTSSYSIENILGARLKSGTTENIAHVNEDLDKLPQLNWQKDKGKAYSYNLLHLVNY